MDYSYMLIEYNAIDRYCVEHFEWEKQGEMGRKGLICIQCLKRCMRHIGIRYEELDLFIIDKFNLNSNILYFNIDN